MPMVCGEDPVCTGEENLHLQQPQTEDLPHSACPQQPCTTHTCRQHHQQLWAELSPGSEQGSRKQAHVKHIYKLQTCSSPCPELPRAEPGALEPWPCWDTQEQCKFPLSRHTAALAHPGTALPLQMCPEHLAQHRGDAGSQHGLIPSLGHGKPWVEAVTSP